MRDQSEQMSADAKLAAMISVDMYDRVKRRSSGVTKDESKKKALQALKDKNHPKVGISNFDLNNPFLEEAPARLV